MNAQAGWRGDVDSESTAPILKKLLAILFGILVLEALIGLPVLAAAPLTAGILCLAALILVVLVPWLLLRAGRILAAVRGVVLGGLVIATASAVISGGVRSPAIAGQVAFAIIAAMLLGRRWAQSVIAACVLADLAMALFQYGGGGLPVAFPPHPLETLAFLAFAFLAPWPVVLFSIDRLRGVVLEREASDRQVDAERRLLDLVMWSADLGSWEWHPETGRVAVSDGVAIKLDYEPGEIEPHADAWIQLTHPDDAPVAIGMRSALADGLVNTFDLDLRLRAKDGEWRWMSVRGRAVENDVDGRALLARGTIQDIHDRKSAERNLAVVARKMDHLMNTVDGVVWEAETEPFRVTFVSRQAEKLLGFPQALWTEDADFWSGRIHPEDREVVARSTRRAVATGKDHSIEYRMITSDGSVVWVHESARRVSGDEGTSRLSGLLLNITDRRNAEEGLRERDLRWKLALEANHDGIFEIAFDRGGERYFYSTRCWQMLGYDDTRVTGDFDFFKTALHPEDRERVFALMQAHQLGTTPDYQAEFRLRHQDGCDRWILARARAARDSDGKIVRVIGTHEDITSRKEAELAIQASEARWHLMAEVSQALAQAAFNPQAALAAVVLKLEENFGDLAVLWLASADERWLLAMIVDGSTSSRNSQLRDQLENPLIVEESAILRSMVNEGKPVAALQFDPDAPTEEVIALGTRFGQISRGHSLISVPLWNERRALGILALLRTRADRPPFTQQDIHLAQQVAASVTSVLKTSTLNQELEQQNFARERVERELRESRNRLQLLADLSRVFSQEFDDPQAALAGLLKKLAEDYADSCSLRLLDSEMDPPAIIAAASSQASQTDQDRQLTPLQHSVVSSGIGALVPVAELMRSPGPLTLSEWAEFRRAGTHSVMAVPMRDGAAVGGVVLVTRTRSTLPPFTRDDLEFVQEVADRAMLAFKAARLAFELGDKLRERRAMETQREEMVARLRELTVRAEEVRETERKRIAREIHDELGQQLTSLKLHSDYMFRAEMSPGQRAAQAAALTREMETAIRTVRRIATELRPGILDSLGLTPALEWLVRDFEEKYGVPIDAAFQEFPANDKTATAIFRVAQEALTNVAKHARAARVWMKLELANEMAALEVSDDGVGMHEKGPDGGFGLIGMRERAILAGGSLEITASEQGGLKLRLTLPVADRRED